LGTFLDLVNVILEAGGSLKNAFFTVSTKAKNIIDDELLKEIAILEYEMTNYSTKQAYENLKHRVDSEQMDKIVEFLILSEETGIGVKNIFTSQSADMRQDKFYKIKGKVSTLNMYLMIVIFVFILPAIGAFVVFPMRAGVLETGF
jgi:tight adherence protein C